MHSLPKYVSEPHEVCDQGQIDGAAALLRVSLLGNPHSRSQSAMQSTALVEAARMEVSIAGFVKLPRCDDSVVMIAIYTDS